MGCTSSWNMPPGLPKAIPKGRWPSLKIRVNSAETSVVGVGEILKKSRPVYHCWLIWPSQSWLFCEGCVQLHPGAPFQAPSGGRDALEPRMMKVLSPKTLSRDWESVE